MDAERLDLLSRISSRVDEQLVSLFELWQQTGFPAKDRQERISVVEKALDETLAEMVDEEKKNFEELLKKIEMREREHVSLSRELGIMVNEDSRASKLSNLTILELDRELRHEVNQLKALKEERMKEVRELKAIDEELCTKLCTEPMYVPTKVVPTDEQLEGLKKHVRDMKTLKSQRLGKFSELKLEIINLYCQLEDEPQTTFERVVTCEDDSAFTLSSDNLAAVESMLTDLQTRLNSNKKYADDLRERISTLYTKLELSGRDHFIAAHRGFSRSVLEELEAKLKELDTLKLQHLEEFILKIREELTDWWNRCYYGAAQRQLFTPFYSDDFTEDLLQQHEDELEKLKKHYNDNTTLFTMVQECQELWAKRLELERLSKDPSRLGNYKILAQEEKDRKRVNVRLPKIQEKLFTAIEKYEVDNGTPFLVGGVPFKDYWQGQVEQHEYDLMAEKQQKTTLKKQQTYHETIYGSVPAANNKTMRANKRPREEQTPIGRNKQAKIERSATASSLLPGRSLQPARSMQNLQRMASHSNLSSARSATLKNPSTSRLAKATPGSSSGSNQSKRVLRDKNESILAAGLPNFGNTLASLDSHDCHAGFHPDGVISSTFRFEPEGPKTMPRGFGTPRFGGMKSSTPSTAPISSKDFVFRTPTSRALTPVNRNKTLTLRNGKRLPFLI